MANPAIFRSAFTSWADESTGKRPVVFDILGPDMETSLLSEGLRLVLHVNPSSMKIQYSRQVERIQTLGGFVEQHWGDAITDFSFEAATGGFMRLYSGLSNVTNPDYGGTRRETIAYDKYLDLLALYKSNGSVHDAFGTIVLQGVIKMTWDGGVYVGWFGDTFSVTESAEKPYQFTLSTEFRVNKEIQTFKSTVNSATPTVAPATVAPAIRAEEDISFAPVSPDQMIAYD